jgi:hypothetical protein
LIRRAKSGILLTVNVVSPRLLSVLLLRVRRVSVRVYPAGGGEVSALQYF